MSKRKLRIPNLTDEEEAEIQAGIARDPDNPEITDEQFARMRPAREVLPPEFFEAIDEMRRARGRPKLETPKKLVSLRLDQDVVEKFRATGKGWQSRINDVLKRAKV
jgi:uncharacterized protein (DUF4415 family)